MPGPRHEAPKGRRHRAREHQDDELESLLLALTNAEKRAALGALGGASQGQPTRDSDSVNEAIRSCGRSVAEILDVLRRSEVGTPKKHFFFGSVTGDIKAALQAAKRYTKKTVAPDVVLSYFVATETAASFLLERTTIASAWEDLPLQTGFAQVRGRRVTKVRHPTIARIDLETGRAMLNYPGLAPGVDYEYDVAITGALEGLAKLGLHLEPLPVKACITSVIAAKGRRVLPVRGELITPEGSLKMRSRIGRASIQQLIARLVEGAPGSGGSGEILYEPDLIDRITSNLGKHTFDAIGLLWTEEKVLTRVAFMDSGADFLFVWGKADPSFSLVARMTDPLYELSAGLSSVTFAEIWGRIVEQPDEGLLVPGAFRSEFKAEASDVDAALLEAVKLGLLIPVYRLKANEDVLDEHGLGEWSADLPSLRQVVRAESGEVIVDGTKPENIRVAFQRVRARAAQQ
jgi:hypothetical protein